MRSLTLLFLFTFSSLMAKESALHVSSGFPEPETFLVESIVKEGFKRAGIPIKYQTVPTERSLINVNLGLDDVEAGRIEGMEKLYPNLVRVPVPIHNIDIVLLSKKRFHIKNISDLKPYHLGLNRGVKIAETIAKQANPQSITEATSYKMLIKMLTNNRIDIIITSKIAIFTILADTNEKGLFMTSKPLESRPIYTYLNKKHQSLIPKLEAAYKSMETDGTIQKKHEQFLQKLGKKIGDKVEVVND
ncbi:MAG: transporter substrate-binding domain-containing protein [Sulfuricurvum sp.]|uniref:substrate-binding periplasmic protein n=1 Tax=Sulfuricurvum sp. TaxID=2025608 RepID=UPI00273712DD|nr:transporter substrate-binding domain-containing protein [Sulfuricurvum sp.]MDP2851714.1 transporter substrate-binding domain-containing protein [Sulfuricurvum sp.]